MAEHYAAYKSFAEVLETEEWLCFWPYSFNSRVIIKPALFEEADKEFVLNPRETCHGRALTLLAIKALNLLLQSKTGRKCLDV